MSNIVFNSTDDNKASGRLSIEINGQEDLNGIPLDSTIVAFVQEREDPVIIINAVPILATDPGNDWPNNIVRAVFSKTDSALLAPYHRKEVKLCIRATISGETETWTDIINAQHLA